MLAEIQHFVNWARRRNPTAHTWRDCRCDLGQFAAAVGEKPLVEVTYRDVDRFVKEQVDRGLKPATINRRLAAVVSLYGYHAVEQPALVCPVIPHRHTLRAQQRLPRSVPAAELERFLAVIDSSRDRAIFLLMLRCGLRISEVTRLRLQDLYLRDRPPRLLVRGKNSKERSVYLSDQAAFALRRYLVERPVSTSEALFLNYKGDKLATIGVQKRLEKYREAAGVQITAHQLRHNFANDLVAAEVPVTSIQKLMGHAWLATTQTYIEANDPRVRRHYVAASKRLESWR